MDIRDSHRLRPTQSESTPRYESARQYVPRSDGGGIWGFRGYAAAMIVGGMIMIGGGRYTNERSPQAVGGLMGLAGIVWAAAIEYAGRKNRE